MRLIDADALNLALADLLDAAPTIPTTTTNNGVTSCSFCGVVVDIEYPEES